MSYKNTYNRFQIAHELLVNRYMLTVLLTNVFNLIDLVQTKEKSLTKLLDKETRKQIEKQKNIQDTIEFNNFSISNKLYQSLLNEYGAEVVTNACVILDKYIETSGKTLQRPDKKLKEWAINLAMKEKLSDHLADMTKVITNIDYRDIDTIELARSYIKGIPVYLRTVDEGCIYLKEKFNL